MRESSRESRPQHYRIGTAPGLVVTLSVPGIDHPPDGHENATRRGIALRLAELMGLDFAGEYEPGAGYTGRVYFIPNDTVVGCDAARLGIRGPDDLFGAVVEHQVQATKAITHPLLDDHAYAPPGWCATFPAAVRDVVLDGRTAFTVRDAERAVATLLEEGPARIKRCSGIGGAGQFRVTSNGEAREVLAALDEDELSSSGIVVEQNLVDVITHSVGQVWVDGMVVSYYGKQVLTRNNRGADVYGGSRLTLVRGDFDTLLSQPLAPDVRVAVQQARVYDDAACASFNGMFGSRRNYDVAQGIDAGGRSRSGVLEQSWRLGGASGAEIAALQAFAADASLQQVRARTVEIFGDSPPPPANAVVYFRGEDARVGMLTKYAVLDT